MPRKQSTAPPKSKPKTPPKAKTTPKNQTTQDPDPEIEPDLENETNSQTTKVVVEIYLDVLKEYKKKLSKEKVIVLMQVGDFFEVYGIVYPDGSRVGEIWEFCENVNLNIAPKKQEIYKNPAIKAFMAGVQPQYANTYIQKAVEKFGWTVVVFEQYHTGSKYERREARTISPGININADSYSNISMVIYIERVKQYYTPSNNTINNNNNTLQPLLRAGFPKSCCLVNIGVSFIDCITGSNGVLAINNSTTSDISIPFDELLKLLTIKNPKELTIYIQNFDNDKDKETNTKLSDDDIINALHLFNHQFKIIRESVNDKYSNLNYQNMLFNTVYNKYRGLMDITQQLDIEGPPHYYTRMSLCLLLDFILLHDKTIIDKLDKPEIILNSDKYLMLANNSLEQLDIIDNLKTDSASASTHSTFKRISLLDLLDNTKTPLGKNLFRNRISTPITTHEELEKRYKTIGEFELIHTNYMKKNKVSSMNDKYGSPLYQLRHNLIGIKNIDNYLRKIITHNIIPSDIISYMDSLSKCIHVYEFLHAVINKEKLEGSTKSNTQRTTILNELIPTLETFQTMTEIITLFTENLIVENLHGSLWTALENNPFKKGISKVLDDLQEEIDCDRNLLNDIIDELSLLVEPKYKKEQDRLETYTIKSVISISNNATKGIHIHTTKVKKELLEEYFITKQKTLKIGTYTITHKDIKFTQMKENKWEIIIIYLKSSNGTLKVNIDKMSKLIKGEMLKWLHATIINYATPSPSTSISTSTSTTTSTTTTPPQSTDHTRMSTLLTFAKFIAEIDVLQSNLLNVVEKGYVAPTIDMSHSHSFIKAEKMRHPIIEHISKNSKYVPNDIALGCSDGSGSDIDGMLLFGVNAVGKSSLMKSIGINIIMAQAGMYVAASHFTYKPYKYLFTRIRNNDNIYAGLSSFEVEMKEFKVILKYANEDSIILGDELCSGTETQDATALVAAGVANLAKRKSSFLFATHLHFLADMPYIKEIKNVKLFHLLVERDVNDPTKLVYTRTLQPGNGPKSYGILVCETMDLDRDFILKAKEIRESMNSKTTTQIHTHHLDEKTTTSKYNINKIISLCELCKTAKACDVHHINQQCDANENNIINDTEHGIFNKNKLWNLVSLCKECHQSIHSVPARISIEGYINTSSGIELKYKVNTTNDTTTDTSNTDTSNTSNSNTDVDTSSDSDSDTSITTTKQIQNNKKNNINNGNGNGKIDMTEINNLIVSLKQSGLSPRKIQYDLKKDYNYDITQQKIRNIL
jgi:DNA mismatch repair protein MutS